MKKPLLAKSYNSKKYSAKPPKYALLTQHSRDVAEACETLADIVGEIGLEVFGLENNLLEQLKIELKANGWLQDLGKVSSHFQEMVGGKFDTTQLLRHETISGLLAYKEDLPFRGWLSNKFSEKSLLTIVWAAMGHHRKFSKSTQPNDTLRLTVDISHPEFISIIQEMGRDLGLDGSLVLEKEEVTITKNHRDKGDINAQRDLRDLQDLFDEKIDLFSDESDKRYLALVKGLGIASDVAASAVAKKEIADYSLPDFIKENFKYGLNEADFLPIIGDKTPYNFQKKVSEAEGYLTFAQAGCGSGKSLAAYLWAKNWCQRYSKKGRNNFRLFFCLPTTGTTTEHFKEYALESGVPPEMLNLTHSRSKVDLNTIAKTAPQEEISEKSKNSAEEVLRAEQDKIESLALWSTPLVVSTTDTVLGLMSNARKPIYSLPSILCGAVVFDEIHAFDDQLFGHLLVFLKNFPKLPILLMTASFPEKRLEAIKKVRPDFTDKDCFNGDKIFAELERYKIRQVTDEEEIWREIGKCVENGGKVLWVRNQVDWANQAYFDCRTNYPQIDVNVYHSRLKYKHRSERHRRVIDNFQKSDLPVILVATQVAEMSLDLSADLLITDVAPISSLIQRMGRLNRKLHEMAKDEREAKSALVYILPENKYDSKPYELDELQIAKEWISQLKKDYGESLSQQNLADCFGKFSSEKDFDIEKAEENAVFFSGLWQTYPGTTRGEGYTINVILEADCENWKRLNGAKQPNKNWLREHEVAIPIRNEIFKENWEIFGGLRVAKSEAVSYDYDEKTNEGTGAKWRK
ncbi:CRISPR-associated helicase/endonuclease Cas3 [soil metagenome]